MKTVTLSPGLLASATGGTAGHLTNMAWSTQTMHITPIPRATEMVEQDEYGLGTTTPDPWQCATENIMQVRLPGH